MKKIFLLACTLYSLNMHAQNIIDAEEKERTFTKVENLGGYPGGDKALLQYLSKNLQYPEKAKQEKIEGTVEVQFIVTKEGKLKDVRAVSGPMLLRQEAVRLIKESGEWKPANACGRYVSSYKSQLVVFQN